MSFERVAADGEADSWRRAHSSPSRASAIDAPVLAHARSLEPSRPVSALVMRSIAVRHDETTYHSGTIRFRRSSDDLGILIA